MGSVKLVSGLARGTRGVLKTDVIGWKRKTVQIQELKVFAILELVSGIEEPAEVPQTSFARRLGA